MEKAAQNPSAAPRRRRRRRGSGNGAAQAAAPQQEPRTRESGKTTASTGREKNSRPAPTQSKKEGKDTRAASRGRRGQAAEPAAPSPASRRGRGAQPVPAKEANHTSRQPQRGPKNQRRAAEEEPGLELITRRPPKQKFSNFEEYLAAHGGMTVPLPDEPAGAPDASEPVEAPAAPQPESEAEA